MMEDGTQTMLAIQSDDNPAADTAALDSYACVYASAKVALWKDGSITNG